MKQRFTKLLAAFALLVGLTFPMGMWGQTRAEVTSTYIFNSKSWGATLNGVDADWTSGQDGAGFTSGQGVQITASASGANATSPISFTDVSQIVVTYCTNSKAGAGEIKIQVGNGTEQSFTVTKPSSGGTTLKTTTFSYDPKESGNVKITVNCTTNSIYIYSVAITTNTGSGPTQLTAPTLIATPDNEKVTLEWTAINNASSYTIQYANNSSFTDATTVTNATSPREITGLTNGTTYYFKAMSVGDGTDYISSDYGESVSATPANLETITITQSDITNFTNSYAWYDWSDDGVSGKVYAYKSGGMQFNSSKDGYWIYNSTAITGTIVSVKMVKASGATDRSWTLMAGTSALTETSDGTQIGDSQIVGTSGATWSVSNPYNYFLLYVSGGSTVISSIEITYIPSTDPIIVAAEPDALAYNATGGEFSYSITNPVAGVSLNAVSNCDWITNVDVDDTNSKVTFTTSANTNTIQRTGTITLSYNGAVDKVITVTQIAGPYTTIPALFEAATSTSTPVTVTFGNWVVTGVNGNQSFVTDGTNGFIMYQKNHGFEVGDILSGTVNCDLVLFNESAEITGLTISSEGLTVVKDGSVTPVVTTINTLQAVNTGSVVTLKNLTYNGEELTDENNNIIVYYTSLYDGTTLETGAKYNVTGVFVWYNSTRRILPRSAADIEQIFTKTINAYTSDGSGEEPANGWYLIASPVASAIAPSEDNGFITEHYDLYRFNQAADKEWENHKIHNFNIESGVGYLYASSVNTTLVFDGTPYSGDGQVTLHKTTEAEYSGWNLVGNPFASNAEVNKAFYKMNSTSDGINVNPYNANSIIAPMEGVFVLAAQDQEKVTFTATTDPVTNLSNRSMSIDVNRNGEMLDRAIVSFNAEGSLSKLVLSDNTTKLYFRQGQKDYAIVASDNENEMPVSFKASRNGTYTLNINTENVEMNYLHLIDNMTGMDVDLLQTPSYTFDATTNDYTSRFRLVFSANDVNEQNAETFAFFSNGNWVVNNEGEATLQVIDVNGRIVSNETINGTVATSINATPGVYMLRLVNGNEVKTQKIVVR